MHNSCVQCTEDHDCCCTRQQLRLTYLLLLLMLLLLQEVGADEYNMPLCLRGMGATEGTAYDDPNCKPWAKVQQ